MKIQYSLTLIASVALAIMSCRKTDKIEDNKLTNNSESAGKEVKGSGWISATGWQPLLTKNSFVNYFVIIDSNITPAIAIKGLVVVYKKIGNTINTLPFEETAEGKKISWIYQVNKNGVSISKEGSSDFTTKNNNDTFFYYVIPEESLNILLNRGYPREKLIQLSFINMKALLKL